ncbi:MAG: RlmE family RNA methyltransferase [Gammaproteobacteria bacterium]
MKKGKAWLQRQQQDPYVKQAQKQNYRSRAAFKLQEIDRRDHLFKPGQLVVELGAAPGSWSQYVSGKVQPGGKVIAVDILEMAPVSHVEFIHGDFTEDRIFQQCLDSLGGRQADIVISDLAPNLTGIRDTDHARSMALAELVLDFAVHALAPHGSLLLKLFQGSDIAQFKSELSARFQKVAVRKPEASRADSREFYMLARGSRV